MSKTDLELRILDLIKENYNANYIGSIEVIKNETSYTLYLGIPTYLERTSISCDAESDDDFISFINLELKKRNYIRQDRYMVKREDIHTPKTDISPDNEDFIKESTFPLTLK